MLNVFRESIGRYIAIAILSLIAITFIFFGIDFSITQLSYAARVNGSSIPIQEFERELQLTQNQYAQLYRDELDDDLRREIRRQVIEEMIMREAMRVRAEEVGYRISTERLVEIIRSNPAFQVGGEFSQDVYRARLTAEGLTPAYYEALERAQSTLIEISSGLNASSFVTPAEFRRTIELYYEQREIAYAEFAAADFLDQVEISDEEVAAYYEENPSLYMTDEAVDIELIDVDLQTVADSYEISEEELRQAYEQQTEAFATSEERRVRHILIEPDGEDYATAEAEAASVVERLEAGEDFAAVAAEVSDDVGTRNNGGDLGWMSRGVLTGPFEDTLFAMEVGTIAGPVETEFGYHILRLDDVRAGEQQPFEQVREQLRAELASNEAYTVFVERAYELENLAYEAQNELASVAEALGVEVTRIDRVTRSGETLIAFDNPLPIIDYVFSADAMTTGENSDMIELSDERVVVARVATHYPPEQEPLEAVAEEIRARLALDAAEELASAAANEFATTAGDDVEQAAELAATLGGTWNERRWTRRVNETLPQELLSLAFGQTKPAEGQVVTLQTPLGTGDFAVLMLLGVEPGVPEEVPSQERESGQQDLRQFYAELETNLYAAEVRARADVRIPDAVLEPQ
ncbi:MAG: SurA N-terminal domain-containing protein [Gammaproteobacteria bacterium]|nr:SurA N-terminal domain-containing protein [Gammaproteobacteria bacterium]